MSRSGYDDDCDGWALIRWRGAVKSALRGARGQAFLREALTALDALPEKRLTTSALVADDGACCTMGAVAKARSLDVSSIDPFDRDDVASALGIAAALAAEIAYENDEGPGALAGHRWDQATMRWMEETDEERWVRMRAWVAAHIVDGAR